jgi:hypothetical protein
MRRYITPSRITAGTALHFDGSASAKTKVKRDLANTSYTIDMMIRPTETDRTGDMVLFEYGAGSAERQFILTSDNRLKVISVIGNARFSTESKPVGTLLDYTRVLFVYDREARHYRFYAGSVDLTESSDASSKLSTISSSELRFGGTYNGDMLEVRVWTKALTPEEITATGNHYLTGYERELLAYYRLNEGKGETVTDRAHGATLYLEGCAWNKQKGWSLSFDGTNRVQLDGNLLARSAVYDATYMLWFNTASDGTLFTTDRVARTDSTEAKGTRIAVENGHMVLYNGDSRYEVSGLQIADGVWHHLIMTVNRTYNHAALFIDGRMYLSLDADLLSGITGAMYFGGDGFKGHIDEFALFEQALPKSLVEAYDNVALVGDEMGLIAYLPFEEQFVNPNGVLEQRFCINDRRQFKDPATGKVVDKTVPLVLGDLSAVTALADNTVNAPVAAHGMLTKLHFDWSFNHDELLINILNQNSEVNKQSVYVTVRDVEDLNGNPMASPVTWTAFVDRNSLKWKNRQDQAWAFYGSTDKDPNSYPVIVNHSGKRHTYTIESLPAWLEADKPMGVVDSQGEVQLTFTYKNDLPVGTYSNIVYLVDEDGLAEPLQVDYFVETTPPYDDVDPGRYPMNMSVCGQVKIGGAYDNDEKDIVYAVYRNECVGQANVKVNNLSNTAEVYLTVYGNEAMNNRTISFRLWQASTGKVFNLAPSSQIVFSHGNIYGCGDNQPVVFTASGSQTQNIELNKGWTWVSTNLYLQPETAPLNTVMTAAEPWKEGDLIKNPDNRQFSTYSEVMDIFMGTLTALDCRQMYMVYSANSNLMRCRTTACNLLPASSSATDGWLSFAMVWNIQSMVK